MLVVPLLAQLANTNADATMLTANTIFFILNNSNLLILYYFFLIPAKNSIAISMGFLKTGNITLF
jgi:hypothetical protein